jgi:hypothetical protein
MAVMRYRKFHGEAPDADLNYLAAVQHYAAVEPDDAFPLFVKLLKLVLRLGFGHSRAPCSFHV